MPQDRRIPGDSNPRPDDREVRGITNEALSRAGAGGWHGQSYGLLTALGRWRSRRAKKKAMAAAEKRRAGHGDPTD